MTAPPPDDPDGPRDPRDLDFDAEFERIVADWGPQDASAEPGSSTDEPGPTSAEPDETPPTSEPSSVQPAETNDSLRNLFRGAWPDEEPHAADSTDSTDEHYVPPPAPPIPRPEPRRLLAWAGLLGAPLVGLLLLVFGALPAFVSFLLFCWFVGGFAYLVATMNDRGGDGWDDGARV